MNGILLRRHFLLGINFISTTISVDQLSSTGTHPGGELKGMWDVAVDPVLAFRRSHLSLILHRDKRITGKVREGERRKVNETTNFPIEHNVHVNVPYVNKDATR